MFRSQSRRCSCCLALLFVIAPAGVSRAGLLAHWSFDSDFADQSGSGRNLVTAGVVNRTVGNGGRFGEAAIFVNDSANFLASGDAAFNIGASDFAVSLWFNSPNTAANDALAGKGDDGLPNTGYRIRLDGGNLQVRLLDSGANTAGTAAPASNVWNHVVAQRSGDNLELWVNGALAASDSGNAGLDLTSGTPTPPFLLGQRTNQFGANPYEGLLDEVWVFDSALSVNEIGNLFRANSLAVPEPATLSLLATAALLTLCLRRGKKSPAV